MPYPADVGFPISFRLEKREGVLTTSGVRLRGVDLAPLLVQVAAPVALIFNANWLIFDDVPAGAGDLAAVSGVQADVRKLVGGHEALVITSADLRAFFDGWQHFGPVDIDAVDWPTPPTGAELESAVAALDQPTTQPRRFHKRRHERRFRGPVLSALTTPTFYYHGHDDHYFYLESRTDHLARLVLRRLIALEAGFAWKRQRITVPDPGDDVVARLLDDSHEWMHEISDSTPESVTIALTASAGRSGRRSSRKPSYVAVFHIPTQKWELLRVVP
jgi:hypothetical protein